MDEAIKELWEAANNHAVIMGGEYVVECEADDGPPLPKDPAEAVRLVAGYLRDSI